ncbi:MAG TPA: hypothetical protein VM581_03605 [Magnetospirillaceae bacterium]|nr:hypothetical protein [Magnetospirillaceae bacterium]
MAKRLAASYQAGWFSTDFLSRPIEVAAAHLHVHGARDGVPNGKNFMLFAQKQWPFISELVQSIYDSKTHYILEGEIFIPQLINTLDFKVVSCFLGYHTADPATKLAEIDAFSAASTNDWTRAYSTQEQLCIINERIMFSAQIATQARQYRMPYFDVSRDFPATIDRAYEMLISRKTSS